MNRQLTNTPASAEVPLEAASRHWLSQRVPVIALALVVLLLVGTLGVAMARGVGLKPDGEWPARFSVAPDFTLPTFDGKTVTLSDYDGKPVLLFFWASWCVACQEEAPLIAEAWPEYQRRGYVFLGVNITDTESDARAFIQKYGLADVPMASDAQGKVYLDYGVEIASESFFLRPGRQVLTHFVNGWTAATLRERLDALESPLALEPQRKRPN